MTATVDRPAETPAERRAQLARELRVRAEMRQLPYAPRATEVTWRDRAEARRIALARLARKHRAEYLALVAEGIDAIRKRQEGDAR
ncbi:hypothetical protein [Frankia sp. Cj3]|uniref:hypothetical protein n=1 Tax=Frankia sp. Cj3 TaxID=2880976 RepID=UPI001EF5D9A8|nr:hypothetical protein [Frankia sp. Cj3]